MNVLVILQGPAYGTEASYNGLRLADNLAKRSPSPPRQYPGNRRSDGLCQPARSARARMGHFPLQVADTFNSDYG
jgi:hypothetical protein